MKASLATLWFALAPAIAAAHESGHAASIDYARAEETPFGQAADPKRAARTIAVDMADTMRFTPAELTVTRGETVRFVGTNRGKLRHEMVLGRMEDLRAHAEMMRQHPSMEHDEPHMLHVAPGKRGEIGWRFTRAGEFHYGCLEPGHFEAGMVGTIKVVDREAPMTDAEVRKVDKAAGKVTLKHGAIPNLGMTPMTMVFRVADPKMLERVRPGDRVRFRAEMRGTDATVVELVPAK